MTKLELTLTDAQLDAIVKTLEKARKNAKTVTVDRDALEKLIVDHTRALRLVPHDVTVTKGAS